MGRVNLLLQVFEIVAEIGGGLVPATRIFGETAAQNPVEPFWKLRVQRGDRRRRVVHDRRDDRDGRVALEGTRAARHLVQNDAERDLLPLLGGKGRLACQARVRPNVEGVIRLRSVLAP